MPFLTVHFQNVYGLHTHNQEYLYLSIQYPPLLKTSRTSRTSRETNHQPINHIFHFSRDSLAACEPRQPLAHHEIPFLILNADGYRHTQKRRQNAMRLCIGHKPFNNSGSPVFAISDDGSKSLIGIINASKENVSAFQTLDRVIKPIRQSLSCRGRSFQAPRTLPHP